MQVLLLSQGGWGGGVCLSDVRRSLISPFVFWPTHSERFLRKTQTLWDSHHHPQNGLRQGGPEKSGDQRRWLQNVTLAGLPPSISTTSPDKMSALHCNRWQDNVRVSASRFKSPPRRGSGVRGQTFTSVLSHREETLSIAVCPRRFRPSSVWVSWLPAIYVLCLRGSVYAWKRGLPSTSCRC